MAGKVYKNWGTAWGSYQGGMEYFQLIVLPDGTTDESPMYIGEVASMTARYAQPYPGYQIYLQHDSPASSVLPYQASYYAPQARKYGWTDWLPWTSAGFSGP